MRRCERLRRCSLWPSPVVGLLTRALSALLLLGTSNIPPRNSAKCRTCLDLLECFFGFLAVWLKCVGFGNLLRYKYIMFCLGGWAEIGRGKSVCTPRCFINFLYVYSFSDPKMTVVHRCLFISCTVLHTVFEDRKINEHSWTFIRHPGVGGGVRCCMWKLCIHLDMHFIFLIRFFGPGSKHCLRRCTCAHGPMTSEAILSFVFS